MSAPSLRRAVAAALVLLAAVAASISGASTQASAPAASEQAQTAVAQNDAPETPYVAPVSEPRTQAPAAQPPRTLRAYWHLFIAFAVTWLLLFGYALSVGRRWARLEREVQAMRAD